MNLSIPELRKRNNFNIFKNRIRDNQSFTINESNGRTVRINNSVFRDINSVDDLVNNFPSDRGLVFCNEGMDNLSDCSDASIIFNSKF